MKKLLLLVVCCLLASQAFAVGTYTTIAPGITFYSKYYSNPNATFKGTIVFENGSGADMSEWFKNKAFLKCARKYGNLFFYDHNGLGSSPPDFSMSAKHPLTAEYNDEKLLKLLQKTKTPTPYIIVAHSYGGLFGGYFALRYPELVDALLLVDPVPREYTYKTTITQEFAPEVAAAKEQTSAVLYKKYKHGNVEVAYLILGFDESKKEVKELGSINNKIPVIILSTTKMEQHNPFVNEDWYMSQKQWLNDNPKSKIIKIDSGHMVPIEHPEAICEQLKVLTA